MPDLKKVIKGLEFTKAMFTFNPSTGEDVEPENLNEEDKITYDACVGAIVLLKEQEAVEPKYIDGKRNHFIKCGNCNYDLLTGYMFCPHCGRKVKWDE